MFSLELANRALPLVRRIVEDIAGAHRRWRELVVEYESTAVFNRADDPQPRALELERETQRFAAEIDAFVAELGRIGVVFQGHVLGLVDFPSEMDGRPVYLCWRLGEPSVQFWHEVDAGYVGRQPLDATTVSAPTSPLSI